VHAENEMGRAVTSAALLPTTAQIMEEQAIFFFSNFVTIFHIFKLFLQKIRKKVNK
jgi:hypothetical protein